jgi:hypothetical protein
MGKYEPLGEFLRKQSASLVPLTFAEIERIIGSKLPSSQKYPAWWSNSTTNNVMTQVWLDAGFETEQVDVERKKVVFRRATSHAPAHPTTGSGDERQRHSLIGWMKGTVTIPPGVDLTEPAEPKWGDVANGDASWNDVRR